MQKMSNSSQLDILIDRLCLCDIPNLPTQLNRNSIQTWAEQYAGEQIKHLENCLKSATDQEKYKEQIRKRDLFTNPQTRGKWLDLHFKTSPPAMPSYAVDGTGKIHRAPEDVKNIYLTERTLFLKKKLEPPGSEGKDERKYPEPPDYRKKEKPRKRD